MKINVVTVRSGWILQKIAERIVEAGNKMAQDYDMDHKWTLSHNPSPFVNVNFYCDIQNCFQGRIGDTKHIGLFTHIHADDPGTVQSNIGELDFIFHMAPRYMVDFNKHFDYPNYRMDIMVPFEPAWKPRKLVLGVFQRGTYEGKGYFFLKDFIEKYAEVANSFDWTFIGDGWDDIVSSLSTDVDYKKDTQIDYPSDYRNHYMECDFILIPSMWEGGPISCLEAISSGIPIIAADVGWCSSWTADIFQPGDINKLRNILVDKNYWRDFKYKRLCDVASYRRCIIQIYNAYEEIR